jgi:hypothetical protein
LRASPWTPTLPLPVCVLPVSASPPSPPVAVAAPPVAVLPSWSIDASLSWMTPRSPSSSLSMSALLERSWSASLPDSALPASAEALPPSPPSASPLSASGSPPKT